MFIYCLDNPIILIDSDGYRCVCKDGSMEDNSMSPQQLSSPVKRTIVKIRRSISKAKKKAELMPDGTVTTGWTGSAFWGGGVSGSVGITQDGKGNIGIVVSANGGGGFPNLSAGRYYSVNNAPTIYHQRGLGSVVGASGGPEVIAIGGEYNMLFDTTNDVVYHGGTVSVTVGLVPACVEVHGELGNTWVWGINIYDVALQIFE